MIRQWSIALNTDDASLKNLVNSLSIGSMEHKLVLEEVFKNFKGLKIPEGNPKFSIDVKPKGINEILISLLENENVMERGYMEIYLGTDAAPVEKNFKLRPQLFFWIFKSLSYDERNHEALIVEYMKNFR